MVRVHLVVEGQTEEMFVRKVLSPHLGSVGVFVMLEALNESPIIQRFTEAACSTTVG